MQTASFCGGGRGASYRLPYLPSTRKILGRWVTFLGQAETAVRPGMRFRFGTMGFLASVIAIWGLWGLFFPCNRRGTKSREGSNKPFRGLRTRAAVVQPWGLGLNAATGRYRLPGFAPRTTSGGGDKYVSHFSIWELFLPGSLATHTALHCQCAGHRVEVSVLPADGGPCGAGRTHGARLPAGSRQACLPSACSGFPMTTKGEMKGLGDGLRADLSAVLRPHEPWQEALGPWTRVLGEGG